MKYKKYILIAPMVILMQPPIALGVTTGDYLVYQSIMQQQQAQALAREQAAQKAQELQLQQQQVDQQKQALHDAEMERCKESGRLVCF